ncbi:MAG TPA: methyltransferase domain-containing protein [Halomicronema sp.]
MIRTWAFAWVREKTKRMLAMFKWNPEDYAKNSAAQLSWARELIGRLNLTGNERILDVGCGEGKITAEISRALSTGYILGIDSSKDMISYAQSTFTKTEFPHLEFSCMDARQIVVEKEFDIVFSNAALHWVDNHFAFLRGANKALRKGGRLFTSCGGKGNIDYIQAVIFEVIKKERWQNYFKDFVEPWHFYGVEEYKKWLEECGFEIVSLNLVPKNAIHSGAEGLAGWIRTTGMPYTQHLPQEKREEFINEIVNLYLSYYPLDPEGNSSVKMVRLEIDALKK